MLSGQWELFALWVGGLREGGIEGGESSSKAICSCVITALGRSWLRLNLRPPDQPIAWLNAGSVFCIADYMVLSQEQAVEYSSS